MSSAQFRKDEIKGETLVDLLRLRALEQPASLAYRFLLSGDVDGAVQEWTYHDLNLRALSIAASLQAAGAEGERALLLFPPSLEFIAAFLGCAAAGVVAVPTYPHRTLSRLEAIAQDCDARFVITTTAFLKIAAGLKRQSAALERAQWIATDAPLEHTADDWRHPSLSENSLLFLQYTSGSTGQPKGVMVSHANVLHNERLIADSFGTDPSIRVVGWLPLYHDMGLIGNVLQPLYLGASCTLMSPLAFLQRPMRWLEAISHFRGTVSGGPNFAYDLCVSKNNPRRQLDLSHWQVAFNGSEPVRKETLDRFAATFAACGFRPEAFCPCYGLAEATLFVTGVGRREPLSYESVAAEALERNQAVPAQPQSAARTLVSSGRCHPDQKLLIVDPDNLRPLDDRSIGEICLTGPSVAQGYWRRSEQTGNVFQARIAQQGQVSFLRTGDLGFTVDGEVYVTGRLKDLIILRGRNLYPQDIECTLEEAHPAIRMGGCAAFSVVADGEEKLAVAAEVVRKTADHEEIVNAIRRAVAEYHGAHVHVVVLLGPKSIPKTSSGKVRRSACRSGFLTGTLDAILVATFESTAAPELDQATLQPGESPALSLELEAAEPHERLGILEQFIRRNCARLLKTQPTHIDPALAPVAIGLDSLMGMELQSELESALGLSLAEGFLLHQDSLSAAAQQLSALWEQHRRHVVSQGEPENQGILPGTLEGELPVSSGQHRLWFLDRFVPGSALYNIHFGLRMLGSLDSELLQAGLNALVQRHSILRTTFVERQGRPRQIVHPPGPVQVSHLDLRDVPESLRGEKLRSVATEAALEPFNLADGPLLRFHLVRISSTENVLLISQHHIITDGWSIIILGKELAGIYEALARSASLPPAPLLQFADYARWELSSLPQLEEHRAFWSQNLATSYRLDLPADRPRPRRLSFAGGRVLFHLPKDVSERLIALSAEQGCTPFMTLLAGYCVWLHRHTRQEEFNVGSFTANRSRPELKEMIGFLANTIVLRCEVSGDPDFYGLLRRVRRVVATALRHARLPFTEIVQCAANARQGDDNPLFQASFILEQNPVHPLEVGSVTWKPLSWAPDGAVEGTAKFDLALALQDTENGFSGDLEYSSDLFDAVTVAGFVARMQQLFHGIAADPETPISALPLLTDAEWRQVIVGWNATRADVPLASCFHHWFEEQAAKTPAKVAALEAGNEITYEALNRRANRLAYHLRFQGVGPEVVVAVLMHRGIDILTSILAIFKAGGAYLPLDPDHPPFRWLRILAQAEVGHMVVAGQLGREIKTHLAQENTERSPKIFAIEDLAGLDEADANPASWSVPGNIAYVIFTSGSTGKPKGAQVEQLGMLNHLHAKIHDLQLGSQDIVAQTASQCFDISVWQFFAALMVGGHISIVDNETAAVPEKLLARTAAEKITILEIVPSMLRAILDEIDSGHLHPPDLSSLRWLLLTGEALPPELVLRWLNRYPTIPVLNAYGPTECSDDVTHHALRVPPPQSAAYTPIGRAILNVRLYVLDQQIEPVPIGVPGELYVGGICVGRGYLKDPLRTAEVFVPDPFSTEQSSRLYRTGDLVRTLPNGEIVFLGRIDYQVKVRGFRIELGEIEAVLQDHPAVRQNVVVVYRDEAAHQELVAYIVYRGVEVGAGELKSWLKERLPEYMVPSAFVIMAALPLSANGKIDRKVLPAPDLGSRRQDYVPPRNPVEESLTQIWREVLAVEQVGVNDDFFAMGGHSLRATQVAARIRDSFAVEIPLRRLFEASTIAQLAALIVPQTAGATANEPDLAPPIPRLARTSVVLPSDQD